MITRYDEFMCHQIPQSFDSVATSAREWTERIWFSVHDATGDCFLIAGFGLYPNRNIMDAYACVVVGNRMQYCVRASRELRPRFDDVTVGPLAYSVTDPLRTVRFVLDPNEHGLSFEIDFHAAMAPHEEHNQFTKTQGRIIEDIKRYIQVGRPTGWIEAGGRRIAIDDSWRAERDHSWGIRRGGGVPETGIQPGEIPIGYVHNFVVAQFDSWSFTFHLREDHEARRLNFSGALCRPGETEVALSAVNHRYRFRGDLRQVNGGEIDIVVADGTKKTVSIKPLSACYLRAGGYFGYRDFVHGLWKGPQFLDGLALDLTNPDQVRELHFLDDVACEFTCGSETGYGIVEIVIIGRYPKYGYESY